MKFAGKKVETTKKYIIPSHQLFNNTYYRKGEYDEVACKSFLTTVSSGSYEDIIDALYVPGVFASYLDENNNNAFHHLLRNRVLDSEEQKKEILKNFMQIAIPTRLNNNFVSPLHLAAENHLPEITAILSDKERRFLDPNEADVRGMTPLHFVFFPPKSENIPTHDLDKTLDRTNSYPFDPVGKKSTQLDLIIKEYINYLYRNNNTLAQVEDEFSYLLRNPLYKNLGYLGLTSDLIDDKEKKDVATLEFNFNDEFLDSKKKINKEKKKIRK